MHTTPIQTNAVVMVISSGTLLVMIDVNAKAQALYSASSNLSFALDSMTRELRTGYHYNCTVAIPSDSASLPASTATSDCADGQFVAFSRERDNVRMGYRIKNGKLEQKVSSGNWMPLTSNDVVIDRFNLTVEDSDTYTDTNDTTQPFINLQILGHVNNGLDTNTDFSIQTHMVGRRLDII
jgi:hypothetical protein